MCNALNDGNPGSQPPTQSSAGLANTCPAVCVINKIYSSTTPDVARSPVALVIVVG